MIGDQVMCRMQRNTRQPTPLIIPIPSYQETTIFMFLLLQVMELS